MGFCLAYCIGSEVKNRRGQNGRCMAIANAFNEVIEIANATRGNHWN
jgi:hypothetical protein